MDKGSSMGKSRKGGGRSHLTKTPVHEGRESKREKQWDMRSDNSDTNVIQARQIENTYRLGPHPERRFQAAKAEHVMKETLREFLADVEYDKTLGQRMSKMLADTIKTRLKEYKWIRYKTVVQVIIGENREQDVRAGSRFLWNTDTDTYASTKFVNRSLFALAVAFGVYFD